jgi:hypothetical protein
MSNVNNFNFARHLDQFKAKILDPQKKRVSEAEAIMHDTKRQWDTEEQKVAAGAKLENYKQWLQFYQVFYDAGMELVKQHETLTDKTAKWYSKWWNDVSNEGHQETEIMSIQADFINEIFSEMYQELKPLALPIEPPKALNLK